jgi:hypothetical protein
VRADRRPQPSFARGPAPACISRRCPQPPTGGTRLPSPTSAVPDPDSSCAIAEFASGTPPNHGLHAKARLRPL